jgi:hemolysin activation/secretion protein
MIKAFAAVGLGLALQGAFLASRADAQTASQITPPSYRPPIENNAGRGLSVPRSEGPAPPAGAEKLFIQLSGVSVDGGFDALAEATRALEAKLTGRRISGSEIFAAPRELETAYANAGYVLVRVVLPPQTLNDGDRLKLVVIDGFIEKIEVKDVSGLVRTRILDLLTPLSNKSHLTLAEIERRVLLAGDTPGVDLHSTLSPGTVPGATILIIDGKHRPFGGLLSLDNTLGAPFGHWTLGLGLDVNSIGTLGELIYLRANGDPNFGSNGFASSHPRNRALAVGFVLPIGIDGLSLNMEATDARTAPIPNAGFSTPDVFQRFSVRLRYPWIRSRNLDFNTEVSLDIEDDTQTLFLNETAAPLYADRLRVFRVTGDGDWISPWGGIFTGRAVVSFGVDALGARSAAAASPLRPLSRQGADADFQKGEIWLTYSQLLTDHLGLNLFARAQSSFGQAMSRSEQIGIATTSGLSSFDAGNLQGDSGIVLRAEMDSPWNLPIAPDIGNAVASPYLFGALGELFLQDPTAVEAAHTKAASYGLGLRLNGLLRGPLSNALLSLEWGRQAESIAPHEGQRFTLVASGKF